MIIRLERTGGFTGIPLRATVDTKSLEPQESKDLEQTIDSARFFELPGKVGGPMKGADRFNYRLTVDDGRRSHTLEFSDGGAPAELQGLIPKLTALARRA